MRPFNRSVTKNDFPIVRISGGLGNQLSQFAFSIALGNETASPSLLDIDSYSYRLRISDRLPLLQSLLRSSNTIVSSTPSIHNLLIPILPDRSRMKLSFRHEKYLSSSNEYFSRKVIRENGFPFDNNLQFDRNCYYVGNFISYGYWKEYKNLIIQEINELLEEYSNTRISGNTTLVPKTLGIHARRGDYLSNPKSRNFHGYCGDDYFLAAVSAAIKNRDDFERIAISSDDSKYAEYLCFILEKFNIPTSVEIESDPILALFNLTKTSAFIGSNSTYSWWAGYLGEEKDLYFPKKWYASTKFHLEPENHYPIVPSLIDIPLET